MEAATCWIMRCVPYSRTLRNRGGAEATEPGIAKDLPLGQQRVWTEPHAVSSLIPVLRRAGPVEVSRPEAALRCVAGSLPPPPPCASSPGHPGRVHQTFCTCVRGLVQGSTKGEDKLGRCRVFQLSAYPHISSRSRNYTRPWFSCFFPLAVGITSSASERNIWLARKQHA